MSKRIPHILFCWLLASLIVPNVALSVTEPMSFCGRIANIIFPLGILGLLFCISRSVGKTVWCMFPLIFLAGFQLVLLSLYGGGIISVDMFLNLVTTNGSEACELLTEMWPMLTLVFVLYLVPLGVGGYCLWRRLTVSEAFIKGGRKAFIYVTSAGVVLVALCYCLRDGYDMRRDLYPVNIGYNIYLTAKRCRQASHYKETSAGFDYEAVSSRDSLANEKYVIVIGETSRANNWELLGYSRHTNPRLSKRDDLLVGRRAYSESNTTHKSVPMLLSCVDSRSFDRELYRVKSLISAFRECGFHTWFISNQLPNHSYIDFFGEEADTTIFVKLQPGHSVPTTDDDLLRYVEDCLRPQNGKQLIVLHTYGSHFDYRERYGEQDRLFVPDNYCDTSSEYRSELVNAYDNTIVATDRLLSSLIDMLQDGGGVSGLLYTSDHGEDLYDDGSSNFLHSSPKPTEYQLHVPLLVWLSPQYRTLYPEVVDILHCNLSQEISTSRSFCATSMSLGGIRTSKVDNSDDLASPYYRLKPLCYLDDRNVPVPLERAILVATAFREF